METSEYPDITIDGDTQRRIFDAWGSMPYAGGLAHSPADRQPGLTRPLIDPNGLASFLEDLAERLSEIAADSYVTEQKVKRYDRIAAAAADFAAIVAERQP